MERRGSGFKKIFEDYSKNHSNPDARIPSLESFPAYFRITLPNLIYEFNDEQLATSTHSLPPVVPPYPTMTNHALHCGNCGDEIALANEFCKKRKKKINGTPAMVLILKFAKKCKF